MKPSEIGIKISLLRQERKLEDEIDEIKKNTSCHNNGDILKRINLSKDKISKIKSDKFYPKNFDNATNKVNPMQGRPRRIGDALYNRMTSRSIYSHRTVSLASEVV